MKTRIISGAVMAVIVGAIFTIGYLFSPMIISIAVALLAAGAIYEIIHNAAGIRNNAVVIGSAIYSAMTVILGALAFFSGVITATVLYCIFIACMILVYHKEFDIGKIALAYALPVPFAMAFFALDTLISNDSGLYYLLLLLNFSCVCDMGAYFVGVSIGKHKLCPEISPKKTVEGAIGGIVSSLVFTVVISLIFDKFSIGILLATIPLCVLGMIGDLFASAIKRSVGLKDYGNLIPGHGGIMDRVDSIIMIAPLMLVMILWEVI